MIIVVAVASVAAAVEVVAILLLLVVEELFFDRTQIFNYIICNIFICQLLYYKKCVYLTTLLGLYSSRNR
jgi:hypothetical protein